MANTLTIVEFERMQADANALMDRAIDKYRAKLYSGCSPDKKPLKNMWLYLRAINSYEQGKFTSLEYTNYINSNDVQLIYSQIKEYSNYYV